METNSKQYQKITFIIFIFSTFILTPTFSQTFGEEAKELELNGHEIGVGAGFSSGVGLTYRKWNGVNGIQFTLTPILEKENTYLSAGVTLYKTIKESSSHKFNLYLGNHYLLNTGNYSYEWTDSFNNITYSDSNNSSDKHWIIGSGVAFELLPGVGRFSVNFLVGLGADISWNEYSNESRENNQITFSQSTKTSDYRVGPVGGIFFFYRLGAN